MTVELLTAEQLAGRIGVKPSTVRRWSQVGKIPVKRLTPKVLRYELDAVVAALCGGRQ